MWAYEDTDWEGKEEEGNVVPWSGPFWGGASTSLFFLFNNEQSTDLAHSYPV